MKKDKDIIDGIESFLADKAQRHLSAFIRDELAYGIAHAMKWHGEALKEAAALDTVARDLNGKHEDVTIEQVIEHAQNKMSSSINELNPQTAKIWMVVLNMLQAHV